MVSFSCCAVACENKKTLLRFLAWNITCDVLFDGSVWVAGNPERSTNINFFPSADFLFFQFHPPPPSHPCSDPVHRIPTHLFEGLLQEYGLQDGIQLLSNVLQETGVAELEAVLQGAHVVGVRELDDLQLVDLLHVFDPLVGLALRVDHQRPAVGMLHDDGVVDGVAARRRQSFGFCQC